MARGRKRQSGPQQHAEGMHGEQTHKHFVEMLHASPEKMDETRKRTEGAPVEGHHRLHQDREQHDEAEKNSEKVEAMRELQRGHVDENVLGHARVPHEGDSR